MLRHSDEGHASTERLDFDAQAKLVAGSLNLSEALQVVGPCAADVDLDLVLLPLGCWDRLSQRKKLQIPAKQLQSLGALMSSAYSCRALMRPVKVAATSVKLAMPPPMMRYLPSGCLRGSSSSGKEIFGSEN